jgi:hypothetical protein
VQGSTAEIDGCKPLRFGATGKRRVPVVCPEQSWMDFSTLLQENNAAFPWLPLPNPA